MNIKTEILDYKLCFEILPLLDESKEYAYDKDSLLYKSMITNDIVKTNVDFDAFLHMQKTKSLHITTVRDDKNKLVGHFTLYISDHSQCTDVKVANCLNIVITEEHRSYKLYKELLSYTEKELKKKGVQIIYLGVDHLSRINKLFQRSGYKEHEILYTKEI